jgi:hypothetical protein
VITDLWIPRLYILAQIVALVVCGVMICLGHNSVITDVFIGASASLLGTSGYTALTKGKTPPEATK